MRIATNKEFPLSLLLRNTFWLEWPDIPDIWSQTIIKPSLALNSKGYLQNATQKTTVEAEGYHSASSCNTSGGQAIDFEGDREESEQS